MVGRRNGSLYLGTLSSGNFKGSRIDKRLFFHPLLCAFGFSMLYPLMGAIGICQMTTFAERSVPEAGTARETPVFATKDTDIGISYLKIVMKTLHRTFRPSLVSGITSCLVSISVEATAPPSLKGTGQSPYMTQVHLQSASYGGWVPAPDIQSGGAGFQTRGKVPVRNSGLLALVLCVLPNPDGISSLDDSC